MYNMELLKFYKPRLLSKNCVFNLDIVALNIKYILGFINIFFLIKQACYLKNVYAECFNFVVLGNLIFIKLRLFFGQLYIIKLKKLIINKKHQKQNNFLLLNIFPNKFNNLINSKFCLFQTVCLNQFNKTEKPLNLFYNLIKDSFLKKKKIFTFRFIK